MSDSAVQATKSIQPKSHTTRVTATSIFAFPNMLACSNCFCNFPTFLSHQKLEIFNIGPALFCGVFARFGISSFSYIAQNSMPFTGNGIVHMLFSLCACAAVFATIFAKRNEMNGVCLWRGYRLCWLAPLISKFAGYWVVLEMCLTIGETLTTTLPGQQKCQRV